MGTVIRLFGEHPPADPPANDGHVVCSWCGDPIERDNVCHDGTDPICPDCLRRDCDAKAWDAERRAIWHVLAYPLNTALGKQIRPTLESVMQPEMRYSDVYALLSELKAKVDATPLDELVAKNANVALHEARGMMADFLKTQRKR